MASILLSALVRSAGFRKRSKKSLLTAQVIQTSVKGNSTTIGPYQIRSCIRLTLLLSRSSKAATNFARIALFLFRVDEREVCRHRTLFETFCSFADAG